MEVVANRWSRRSTGSPLPPAAAQALTPPRTLTAIPFALGIGLSLGRDRVLIGVRLDSVAPVAAAGPDCLKGKGRSVMAVGPEREVESIEVEDLGS